MKRIGIIIFFLTIFFSAKAQLWIEAGGKAMYGFKGFYNGNVIDDRDHLYRLSASLAYGAVVNFNFSDDHGLSVEWLVAENEQLIAFTALDRLYVMNLSNGQSQRMTHHDFTEAMPVWSPKGDALVFSTWEGQGGHLYKINLEGKKRLTQLTEVAGLYTQPAWSYQTDRIAFLSGSMQSFQDSPGPYTSRSQENLAWISSQ